MKQASRMGQGSIDHESILAGAFPNASAPVINEVLRLLRGEVPAGQSNGGCLSETQAAHYCGISKWAMQRLRKKGAISPIHVSQRIYVYQISDLDSFLGSHRQSSLKVHQSQAKIQLHSP